MSPLSYIVFLHQTTTGWLVSMPPPWLSYIVFLHQTTTMTMVCPSGMNCLISSFYIKPQPRRRVSATPWIVLYRLSTSNHNLMQRDSIYIRLSYIVFLHQTTTVSGFFTSRSWLSYIVFLHQTTTTTDKRKRKRKLSYIVFLHQTTTTCKVTQNQNQLSYIVFLHQTTT